MDAEQIKTLESAFVAGFRDAPDKRAFLELARIPLTIAATGSADLRLLEVRLDDRFRVGSASPGFGTRELSYQPLPGALVTQNTHLSFIYVSANGVVELTFEEALRGAPPCEARAGETAVFEDGPA